MFTDKDLGYIIYNNRSVQGVVKNFISSKINPYILKKVESDLDKSKLHYEDDTRMVEVNKLELNLESGDVIVTKKELQSLTSLIKENLGNFSEEEYSYLVGRGIGEQTINKWNLLGLSSIKDRRHLEILGATCHPILTKILVDGIEHGGIIIPLFEDGVLINCAIRKINSSKSLKYSLACPDIPVWGLNSFNPGEEIWITEGLFDMMALEKTNKKSVSCSSAMWSGIQLYKLLQKKPGKINIFSDNDQVGLRISGILKKFFELNRIETKILISEIAKDPAEHYFQKERNLSELIEIESVEELLKIKFDNSFDFLKHLKNRKY